MELCKYISSTGNKHNIDTTYIYDIDPYLYGVDTSLEYQEYPAGIICLYGIICKSPIKAMIGYCNHEWELDLIKNIDELYHLVIYRPDIVDEINGLRIFKRDNQVVFISDSNIVYDRYNMSIHQDLFLNTTIEPEPFASIDSHIIYPEDLFWQQIDENIKKYRYIIPKYTILDIGDTVKVAKRDLDAFNLWEVCPIDDYDEDQYIIHERYNDYTICCSDNNIDYLYLYNNVEDMDIMMRDYMNEHKPYKMPNNTVIEYGNKVFPITQNTRILDPSKIPEDWRDRSELLEYGYMTDNVGKVSLNEKIEINNIPKIFTIHIKKERRAYFVYATPTSDTKLYRIYASFSKGCLAKLPDEVTPYTKKPTSYSDITIICHKIHYNQRV